MRHAATFEIACELIQAALHMPDDVTVLAVELDLFHSTIKFTVAHPDLPKMEEGARPSMLVPSVTHIPEKFVWDWNIGWMK